MQAGNKRRTCGVRTTIAAALTLLVLVGSGLLTTAQAQVSFLWYVRGYALENWGGRTWLCYGWANGAYHCTKWWHRAAGSGTLVSDNPAWVPNVGSGGATTTATTANTASAEHEPDGDSDDSPTRGGGTSGSAIHGQSAIAFCTGPGDFSNVAQWAVPHGCYGQVFVLNPASFPSRPGWGYCNWAPEEAHLEFAGAGALFQTKHWGAPRVGAVIWYSPFDQGASADGHWGELIAIGPNGWGLSEEMNFYWRGGGFGRIIYRFIQLYAPGTAYLY